MELAKQTTSGNKFLIASNGSKIKNLSNEIIDQKCSETINKLFALSGQKLEVNDVFALTMLFRIEILTHFQNLTIEEVQLACEFGIRKRWGDYFGINIVSIHSWVKSYLNDLERLETIKKKMFLENPVLKKEEITEKEIELIMENAISNIKKTIQNTDFKDVNWELFDLGNSCYNYLDKKGLIKISDKEKNEVCDAVRKKLLSEANHKKSINIISENNFVELVKQIESKTSSPVIIRAKKVCLFNYFKNKI